MKRMRIAAMLLAFMVCGIQAWSYRITDKELQDY